MGCARGGPDSIDETDIGLERERRPDVLDGWAESADGFCCCCCCC